MNFKSVLLCIPLISALVHPGCASKPLITAENVDIQRFMGQWYVLAGRFTSFEKGVHNGIETYALNPDEDHIQIGFTYNQDSLTGEVKSIPQKGWVYNKDTKAHWKVQPWWPLRFNYLIVAVADDYSWTAVGVPSQEYLWIMARDWHNPEATIKTATDKLKQLGYDSTIKTTVPHKH